MNLLPKKLIGPFLHSGQIRSLQCSIIIKTKQQENDDAENLEDEDTSEVCESCLSLKFSMRLQKVLSNSVLSANGILGSTASRCNDKFVSFFEMTRRRDNLKIANKNQWFLGMMNSLRTNTSLTTRNTSYSRVIKALCTNNVPALRIAITNHIKNGKGMDSLAEKIKSAAETVITCNNKYRRRFVTKCYKSKGGEFPPEYLDKVQLCYLMWKMGCGRLLNTFGIKEGGVSKRTIRRRIADGSLHLPEIMITHSLNDAGEQAIKDNMYNALFCEGAEAWLPSTLVSVVVMFDGIAVDPRISVDTSQTPHQLSGFCRHCDNPTFAEYADYFTLLTKFHSQDGEESKFHVACECEVVALGFIGDNKHTAIIPVAISPTCKKDSILNKWTHSIQWILDVIIQYYYANMGPSKIGPLLTLVSDGAAHFL